MSDPEEYFDRNSFLLPPAAGGGAVAKGHKVESGSSSQRSNAQAVYIGTENQPLRKIEGHSDFLLQPGSNFNHPNNSGFLNVTQQSPSLVTGGLDLPVSHIHPRALARPVPQSTKSMSLRNQNLGA